MSFNSWELQIDEFFDLFVLLFLVKYQGQFFNMSITAFGHGQYLSGHITRFMEAISYPI